MKQILFTFIITLIALTTFSQAPQAFNYQGLARDLNGSPIANQNIGLRISILQNSTLGTEVYKEVHTTSSNQLGLFNIQIGNGNAVNGTFEDISWGTAKHYVQVELDESGGSNYQIVGASQLLSVPFALYASNGSKWEEVNNGIAYTEGNVGIATQNIEAKLHVTSSDVDVVNVILSNSTPAGVQIHMDAEDSGGHLFKLVSTSSSNTNGSLGSFGIKDETVVPQVGNVDAWRFLIDDEGNIGIGTVEPVAKLHVQDGDIYLDDVHAGIIMKSPNGQCWRMTVNNSGQPEYNSITCPN